MTSSTRRAHLAMADHRAMEEQMERHNPVNPKQMLSNKREKVMRNVGAGRVVGAGVAETLRSYKAKSKEIRGAGATPSMGLSEFRGGMKGRAMKEPSNLHRAEASEAHQMGLHLGKHLHGLHGGAYHKEFVNGMMEGGGLWDSIKSGFTDFGHKVAHEFQDPHSVLRGEVIPIGSKVASVAQPFLDVAMPGLGTAVNTGFKAANYANEGAKMMGYGKTGPYEGMGKKKTRRPAAAGDGRRKRAEIVKRVMAERGLKMIEASKYVKEHGLY